MAAPVTRMVASVNPETSPDMKTIFEMGDISPHTIPAESMAMWPPALYLSIAILIKTLWRKNRMASHLLRVIAATSHAAILHSSVMACGGAKVGGNRRG